MPRLVTGAPVAGVEGGLERPQSMPSRPQVSRSFLQSTCLPDRRVTSVAACVAAKRRHPPVTVPSDRPAGTLTAADSWGVVSYSTVAPDLWNDLGGIVGEVN
jgi:hypothetical protein